MKQHLFALSLGFAGVIFLTHGAHSADGPQCAIRADVIARLAEVYGETRQGVGLANGNAVVELFTSPKTGTWTITVTLSNGMTCLVVAGENYEQLNETPGSPV